MFKDDRDAGRAHTCGNGQCRVASPINLYEPSTPVRTHLSAIPWEPHKEHAALDFGRIWRPGFLASGQNKLLAAFEESYLARRDFECSDVVDGIGRNQALVERKFRQITKNAHGVTACGAGSTKFLVDMMGSNKERSTSWINHEC